MISADEIRQALAPSANPDTETLKRSLTYLTDLNLSRQESDNITAAAIKFTKENGVG